MCLASVGWNVADDDCMIVVWPFSISNGPYTGRSPARPASFDLEAADEALALAEVVRRDLVAHRAGHAVVGQPVAELRQDGRQVREDLALVAGQLRFVAHLGMWQIEHSSWMAAWPSDGRSISRRTPASSTDRAPALAIMLVRQSKPIEMSSPVDVVRPLWQATQRSEV